MSAALTPREIMRTLRVKAVTVSPRPVTVMGMDFQKLTHHEVQEVCRRSNEYSKLVDALRKLTDLCDHVPVFQLDDGKASVKAVRLAGKFTGAHRTSRALLRSLGEAE